MAAVFQPKVSVLIRCCERLNITIQATKLLYYKLRTGNIPHLHQLRWFHW